jgi:hypothetical protein
MSGEPAASGAQLPRVVLVDGGKSHDVFEVIEERDGVVRARAPFLFEIGEEMTVQIERDGTVVDAQARVRAHVVVDGDAITELELSDQSEPRRGAAS